MEGLLTWKNFDIEIIIIFEEPKIVKGLDDTTKTWRINIKYIYPSGKTSKLSIKTPVLFSWGIQENNFSGDSYTIPLVMYNSNEGQTKDERKTIKLMESILKQCKNHINTDKVKETIEQYNIEHGK